MKLPINSLLYLSSLGLAGGSGYLFYESMQIPPSQQAAISEETQATLQAGRERTPDDLRDDYSQASQAWWEQFRQANFIGKLPPKPVEVAAPVEEEPVVQTVTPIKDLLDVDCAVFMSNGESTCVVRYKPEANVQRPPSKFGGGDGEGSYSGPGDVGAAPVTPAAPALANRGRGRRPGNQQPGARPVSPMPTFGGDDALYHHLAIGDSLWEPYSDVVMASVQERPLAVVFRREGKLPEGVAAEERVFHKVLDLDDEVFEHLSENGAVSADTAPRPRGEATAAQAPGGQWQDVGARTKAVEPGQWHISRQDNEMLTRQAEEVFHQDISLRTYTSRSGSIRGVIVNKVSPRMQRFGVQAGDVLLELNGVPVRSKAEALSVGKKQYRAGVRAFTAKILNRYGRIEERTYYVPNE